MKDCINLCSVQVPSSDDVNPLAAKLLVGIDDDEKNGLNQQISDVVLLPNKRLSSIFERLLKMLDPKFRIYCHGAIKFASSIKAKISTSDDLSSGPLEATYYWSLSSRAALYGELTFQDSVFDINCDEQLVAGRLFPADKTNVYDLKNILPDIIYYADERNGKPTHPLCYMFFKTKPMKGKKVVNNLFSST